MNEQQRDELLIRIDERQQTMFRMTLEQTDHLKRLNNHVATNQRDIALNRQRLDIVDKALEGGVSVKINRNQAIVGGSTAGTMIGIALFTLGKALGWW